MSDVVFRTTGVLYAGPFQCSDIELLIVVCPARPGVKHIVVSRFKIETMRLFAMIKEDYFNEIGDSILEVPMMCYLSKINGEPTIIFYEKNKDGSPVNGRQLIGNFEPTEEIDTELLTQLSGKS